MLVSTQMTLLPSYDYQMMPSITLMSSSSSSSSTTLGTTLGPVSPAAALASCDNQLTTNCSVDSGANEKSHLLVVTKAINGHNSKSRKDKSCNLYLLLGRIILEMLCE